MALVKRVELSKLAIKQIRKLPKEIVFSFQQWVLDVEAQGLEEVRKIPGYHDEPLKGSMWGLRSVRLSRAYRAYYRVDHDQVRFVKVERIDKHEY